ncbi:MAG: type II toxin-antitoxin system VapC family toxin [Solirubrobacteraceae bacterium]
MRARSTRSSTAASFVDTSYWIALQSRRDARHPDAAQIWRSGPGRMVTTNHVLGETWTFLRRAADHVTATGFLDRFHRLESVAVHHVDRGLEDEAWEWLRRHDEREYSFVDATSFALMRQLRLREALAFDGDFSAAGFVEVRAA